MAITEAQKKATAKYKANNVKRIPLDVQKERYEEILSHAQGLGETVNGFIKRAISETMERDKANSGAHRASEGV